MAVILMALGMCPAQAQLVFFFDANIPEGGIAIPDADVIDGTSVTRTIIGSGIAEIGSISVKFTMSGGFNGDLYMSLIHGEFGPDSPTAILLNRVGKTTANPSGYGDSGFFDVTFSIDALHDIHAYQNVQNPAGGALSGGDWMPSARFEDGVFDVTDETPRDPGHDLSIFSGLPADGNWTLFLADTSEGGVSVLENWTMQITAVPEPAQFQLAVAGLLTGLAGVSFVRRRWRKSLSSL